MPIWSDYEDYGDYEYPEDVQYTGKLQRTTAKAFLVDDMWFPKSKVKVIEEINGNITIDVPNWLAIKKGIE